MIIKKSLHYIADVLPGYSFRAAIEPSENGNALVIQAKDINSDEVFSNSASLTRISLDPVQNSSRAENGDVLLVSRGATVHKSTVFKSDSNNVIASSSLFIIRIKDASIMPEYLSLYLNSPEGQSQLAQITTGAYIKNLARQNLAKLEIPIPELIKQKNLFFLQQNITAQEKIQMKKIQIKRKIINSTIKNILRKQDKWQRKSILKTN